MPRLLNASRLSGCSTPAHSGFIDRRFYRRKYDAAQTLAQFARTAREEVELETLAAELVQVVQGTMQPERVTIWLKTSKNL